MMATRKIRRIIGDKRAEIDARLKAEEGTFTEYLKTHHPELYAETLKHRNARRPPPGLTAKVYRIYMTENWRN